MIKTKLYKKSCLSFCLVVCVFVAFLGPSCVVFGSSPPAVSGAISDALDYLESVQSVDGGIGDFVLSSWVVMAIVAAGEDPDTGRWVGDNGDSVVDYLVANKDQLDSVAAENYPLAVSRFMLSMTAAGVDATDVDGVDYVSILKSHFVGGQMGEASKINDDFWAVLALVSAGESVSSSVIQGCVAYIKANQNGDGGWGWAVGGSSDVDDSAAAVMALMCAGEDSFSQTLLNGVQYLMDAQQPDGGFLFGGDTTSDSASWVMGAIVASGHHPAQWPVAGPSVVENLLTFQQADGHFIWSYGGASHNVIWDTAYAIQALCYNPYPVNVAPFDATLRGDYNGDWKINFNDINSFVNCYISYYVHDTIPLAGADFNRDNQMNFLDINAFVNYYIGYYT